MAVFFTSDTHFGHHGIMRHAGRSFASTEEMDGEMIRRWNEVIRPDDEVYHLGDLSFKGVGYTADILNTLNGRKHWIVGNHDKGMYRKPEIAKLFESIQPLKEIKAGDVHIVMCHYPMLVWNKSHYGAWMLHGHSHGTCRYPSNAMRIMDVGVDCNRLYPFSFAEVSRHMEGKRTESFDHHQEKAQ